MRRWKKLQMILEPFRSRSASLYAAAAAYSILLSMLPSAALFLSLIPYLPVPLEIWSVWMAQLLPKPFVPIAVYVLELAGKTTSAAVLSVSAVVTLWSASRGALAMMDGLNHMMGSNRFDGFFRRRWTGILAFVMMIVLVFLIVVIQSVFAGIFTGVFLIILFSMLYRVLPKNKLPLPCCLLGGSFAGVGWIVLSRLFSIYVNHFAKMEYGALGLLLLACVWLRLSILLLFYGAILGKLVDEGSYHPFQIIKDAFL